MAKLVIICGLPGTGKTTLAKKIAARIGGILLRTDKIRKELRKKDYSKRARTGVYEEMFLQAKKLLKEGKDVILDATFYTKKKREAAKKITKESGANFKIIEVVCPQELVKKRMSRRTRLRQGFGGQEGDESEARFKHYLIYKKIFEPIKEKHIIIDTSLDIERQLTKI